MKGHTAAVGGTQACVGEQVDHVHLGSIMHGNHGASFEVDTLWQQLTSELAHKALEGDLAQKHLRGRIRRKKKKAHKTYPLKPPFCNRLP